MSIWQLRLCSFSKDIIPLPAHQLTLELLCKIPAWQEVFQSPTAVQHEFEKLHGHHTWMGSALFWPYTSCLFLWGYIKSKLYAKPLNLSQFEERICTVCSEVGKEILRNVIEACFWRWLKIVENASDPLEAYNKSSRHWNLRASLARTTSTTPLSMLKIWINLVSCEIFRTSFSV